MKKNNKKGNIYFLMIKNYILFTLLLFVSIIVLFFVFGVRTILALNNFTEESLTKNIHLLENEKYAEFPVEQLLGPRTFIIVLDHTGNQVYASDKHTLSLTDDELYYVPKYNGNLTLNASEITKGKKKNYAVEYESAETGNKTIYIWDDNFQPLYCSDDKALPPMSANLFSLLSCKYFKDYSINKYPFKDKRSSETYTLLVFLDTMDFSALAMIGRNAFHSILLLAVTYVFMIIGFSWWLKRKITTPLAILQNNLINYEIGNSIDDQYRGPKEFCDIFDSYKEMASRLEDSEKKRIALEEEKQNMLTGVAHDLKTPITVIQGYAEALRDHVVPTEKQQEYQSVIVQKAKDLNELINNFYEFRKMEHSSYSLNKMPSDICVFLRDYIADRYAELSNAGFEPEVDIPEQHILCNIDKAQFKRVFDNIINNSVKHNPKGTTLYVKLSKNENIVTIILGDRGIGIPENLRDNIFKPFIMGDASRKGNGSGLGLAVALRIVESHGGRIQLLPEYEDLSTAFEIMLPIYS